jgi:hypothetical protein
MKFDDLVDMYMEEFHPSVKRLGFKTNVTNNGPTKIGPKPDGFKGDTGMQTPQLIDGGLFPKRRNKKLNN